MARHPPHDDVRRKSKYNLGGVCDGRNVRHGPRAAKPREGIAGSSGPGICPPALRLARPVRLLRQGGGREPASALSRLHLDTRKAGC